MESENSPQDLRRPAARYQRCEEVLADLHRCRARPSVAPGMSHVWVDPGGLPALPPGLDEVAPTGRWQRLRARVLDLLGSHASQLVRKLQNTEQQVDGAVLSCRTFAAG